MHTYVWFILIAACGGGPSGPASTTPDPTRILEGPFTGIRVSASPDLTGDGEPDILISSPGITGDNGVFVFSGAVSGDYDPSMASASVVASEDYDIGEAVSACGDMNGDGQPDMLVGAPNGQDGKGGAWLIHGPLEGEVATANADHFAAGLLPDGLTGYALTCGADMNGDGLFDMSMSAPDADGFGIATFAGQVYFLEGSPDGPSSVGNFSTTFSDSQLGYHQSLVLEDDLSGDGIPDIVIGAHGVSRIHMVFGPIAGSYDANSAGPELTGDARDGDGHAISTGDLDGDGYADLAIGAPFRGNDNGRVSLIPGPFEDNQRGTIASLATVTIDGQDPHELTGWSVKITDDIDGDGNKDLLIGAPGSVTVGPEAGVTYLFYGPATGADTTLKADVTLVGGTAYGRFGHAVTDVPDLDGDGGAEILVGAPYLDTEETVGAGGAFLFYSGLPSRTEAVDADAIFIF